MKSLSPSAQAVLDAVDALYEEDIPHDYCIMAAALRAAADLVAPETYECFTGDIVWDSAMGARSDDIREALLVIADELEAQ